MQPAVHEDVNGGHTVWHTSKKKCIVMANASVISLALSAFTSRAEGHVVGVLLFSLGLGLKVSVLFFILFYCVFFFFFFIFFFIFFFFFFLCCLTAVEETGLDSNVDVTLSLQ